MGEKSTYLTSPQYVNKIMCFPGIKLHTKQGWGTAGTTSNWKEDKAYAPE